MTGGRLYLADYPADLVKIVCDRCSRVGQYHRATLARKFGVGRCLPDLLNAIATGAGCNRVGNMSQPCGAHYADLMAPQHRAG